MVAGAASRGFPRLRYAKAACAVKNEDVCFVREDVAPQGSGLRYSLYAICDGHNGPAAARFVEKNLAAELIKRLPSKGFPMAFGPPEGRRFANKVNEALVEAFAELDAIWRCQEIISGTTVTVAVVIGWLLTVANIGDSLGFLRSAGKTYRMTTDHRLQTNASEINRLKMAGVLVAPVSQDLDGPAQDDAGGFGPLRAWPGGLAVGRSLGDIDAKPDIVSRPHIRQVVVPESGGRLVLASDGLWDMLKPKKVMSMCKSLPVQKAPNKLVKVARKAGAGVLSDDVSVVVLDIIAPHIKDFATQGKKHMGMGQKNGAWLCCSPRTADDCSRVEFIADIDTLRLYPIVRSPMTSPVSQERDPHHLTVHQGHGFEQSELKAREVLSARDTCHAPSHRSGDRVNRSAGTSEGFGFSSSPFEVQDREQHWEVGLPSLGRYDSAAEVSYTPPSRRGSQGGESFQGVREIVGHQGVWPRRLDSAQDM